MTAGSTPEMPESASPETPSRVQWPSELNDVFRCARQYAYIDEHEIIDRAEKIVNELLAADARREPSRAPRNESDDANDAARWRWFRDNLLSAEDDSAEGGQYLFIHDMSPATDVTFAPGFDNTVDSLVDLAIQKRSGASPVSGDDSGARWSFARKCVQAGYYLRDQYAADAPSYEAASAEMDSVASACADATPVRSEPASATMPDAKDRALIAYDASVAERHVAEAGGWDAINATNERNAERIADLIGSDDPEIIPTVIDIATFATIWLRDAIAECRASRSSLPGAPSGDAPSIDKKARREVEHQLTEILSAEMQSAWDDFTTDTGCYPDDFTVMPGRQLAARFGASNFVRFVASGLLANHPALASSLRSPASPGAEPASTTGAGENIKSLREFDEKYLPELHARNEAAGTYDKVGNDFIQTCETCGGIRFSDYSLAPAFPSPGMKKLCTCRVVGSPGEYDKEGGKDG